jgi:hypothetical protein
MKIPDRETAERVTWMTEMLLSHGGHALPAALRAALREYKSALLAGCSGQRWDVLPCGIADDDESA